MVNPILVTCVYKGKSDWLVGGKDCEEQIYISSLKNLANLGLPMQLYCWPHAVNDLDNLIKPFFKEYKIIGCDLFDYPRSADILTTKNNFVWRNNDETMYAPRNELLCHWKLKWCNEAKNNQWGCNKVVWIDAGITEWGKIPESLGGAEYIYPNQMETRYPDSHFWPQNKHNVFSPKIADGLKRILSDKPWFFITQDTWNDRLFEYDWEVNGHKTSKILKTLLGWDTFGANAPDKLNLMFNHEGVVNGTNIILNYPAWTVGTIFGGKFEELDRIIPLYDKLFDAFTDDPAIHPFTEEPFYSIIAHIYKYNLFWFSNWNHGNKDEPCFHSNSGKPFYDVVLEIINYKSD